MFFGAVEDAPMSTREIKAAVAVCLECPVRLDCLFTALDTRENYGVWGGTSSGQRRRLMDLARNDPHRALRGYLAGRLPS